VIAWNELHGAVGRTWGPTRGRTVTREQLDRYRRATGDGADGHCDVVPPLLLLSLTNQFLPELLSVGGTTGGVNYGTESVRFPLPVTVGGTLYATAELLRVSDVAGGVQATVRVVVRLDGREEPACIADTISRYLV
jgi:acyl dehydratase